MFAAILGLVLSAAPPTATCAHAAALRTVDADPVPIQHHFQNGTLGPLRLWWIDREGKRVESGAIEPGKVASLQTYRGHVFLLTDPKGKCRAAVRVDGVMSGSYVGTSRYRPVAIAGWHVLIDRALDPKRDPARAALTTIARMLGETEAALPAAALAKVRDTPIMLLDHAGWGGMFHYSPDWLVAHGRTVELVNAIEISDAASFLETAKQQPAAVLHELAHSYYNRLTESERAETEAVFRQNIASGLYAKVARGDGWVGPAYASGSAVEYFAETSEAWFGRNDFFPFTRAELATYDPAGAALMARLWR